MYGLRGGGGNHFSFHGGARSDFVILQDPHFNLGRLGSERGIAPSWDTSRCPTKRAPGHVISKILASSREGDLRRTGQLPKAAASTAKSSSSPLRSASTPALLNQPGVAGSSGSLNDVDSFLYALSHPTALPTCSREGHFSNVTKHFQELRSQLTNLKERYARDPEGVRQDMLKGEAWKFWAHSLKDLQRRQIWGEDLLDGFPNKDLGRKRGVGKFKYIYPNSMPINP
mmetsp:Transcript_78712/g.228478  ORF Transcript_78712/g.228478 Transcript_78712/m.228478 type:complete len:228 (+) Transcript_78712:101-784(+)